MFTKLLILEMHNINEVSVYEPDVPGMAERGRNKTNLEIGKKRIRALIRFRISQ